MNRNGLLINNDKWTGEACPICESEIFQSDIYVYCSSDSCDYVRNKANNRICFEVDKESEKMIQIILKEIDIKEISKDLLSKNNIYIKFGSGSLKNIGPTSTMDISNLGKSKFFIEEG